MASLPPVPPQPRACAGMSVSSNPGVLTRSRHHGAAFTPNPAGWAGWGHLLPPRGARPQGKTTPAGSAVRSRPGFRVRWPRVHAWSQGCVCRVRDPNSAQSPTRENSLRRGPRKRWCVPWYPRSTPDLGTFQGLLGPQHQPRACVFSPERSWAPSLPTLLGCPPEAALDRRARPPGQMLSAM